MSLKTNHLDRLAYEVLESLDRWDARLQGHQREKRQKLRRRLHTRMSVLVPAAINNQKGDEEVDPSQSTETQVWSRNITEGGLAFIHPGRLKTEKFIICIDSSDEGKCWVHADLVRSRQVHPEFWEYAVQFTGRIDL